MFRRHLLVSFIVKPISQYLKQYTTVLRSVYVACCLLSIATKQTATTGCSTDATLTSKTTVSTGCSTDSSSVTKQPTTSGRGTVFVDVRKSAAEIVADTAQRATDDTRLSLATMQELLGKKHDKE
jgi:hypothetical protein